MKKIFLFFVVFVFSAILAAQETQNEQTSEQNEPAAAAEEVKENGEAAPVPAPAAENQESEAQTAPQEEKLESEITEKSVETEKQEVQNETPAPAADPSETAKEEPAHQSDDTEKTVREAVAKKEKTAKIFYQPSAGIGLGASIFSFRINNDIDFLLKHTPGGTNVYMGLEIDFRYSPYFGDHSIYEIPLQMNFLFDFPVNHKTIERVALWFSAGVDLAIGYLPYYDYSDDYDEESESDSRFEVMAAWGFGVNMLFYNDITLKLGFDSFYGKYPDIICAAGYRF